MQIYLTIVPIFLLVALGWVARHMGFLSAEFMVAANRLVFYFAIPAMLFNALAKAALQSAFHVPVLLICVGALVTGCLIAWLVACRMRVRGRVAGSFIQSAFHGNYGYIGFAVVYYYLGEKGFVQASILAGFLMILQNVMAVVVLQIFSGSGAGRRSWVGTFLKIAGNPVICSALAGMLYALSGLPLPVVAERSLRILSGMALPMALLIIGGSLNFNAIRAEFRLAVAASIMKLVTVPGIAWALFTLFGYPSADYLPGLILLACPTATVVYVLAREMGGAPDFVVVTISMSTLASLLTLSGWLALAA